MNLATAANQLPLQRQKVAGGKPMPVISLAQKAYFKHNRKKLEAKGVDTAEWLKGSDQASLPLRAGGKPLPPSGSSKRSHWAARSLSPGRKKANGSS
jgi:hypothetical protein